MARVVKCLPNRSEALNSISTVAKKKKKKEVEEDFHKRNHVSRDWNDVTKAKKCYQKPPEARGGEERAFPKVFPGSKHFPFDILI
jgi:hypothetical protein